MKPIVSVAALAALLILTALASPDTAFSQDYNAILQGYLAQDAQLGQRIQQTESGIVQQNMQNPQVQAMYQQHLQAGGQMTFEQFAYGYAATAGYTPQGIAAWNQSQRAIQSQEQAAAEAYRRSQAANAEALRQMHEQNARIANDRGNLLSGNSRYAESGSASSYLLPHTVQPGSTYYDAGSGNTFYRDDAYNYYRVDQFGNRSELEEEE